MIKSIFKFFLVFSLSFLITCGGQDISMITSVEEVIIPDRVVVEYIIQPIRPESLDVLAIVDLLFLLSTLHWREDTTQDHMMIHQMLLTYS